MDNNNLAPFKKDFELLGKDILKHPLKYLVIFIALVIAFKFFF